MNLNLKSTNSNFERYKDIKSNLIIDTNSDFHPEISIMIPTFKRTQLLASSLKSAINQKTNLYYEIVIVDNDADGEFETELLTIIKQFESVKIRYFKNEKNIGMFGNWNRCIELARAKWLTILNDDDCLMDNFISETFKFTKNNELIFVDIENVNNCKKMNLLLSDNSSIIQSVKTKKLQLSSLFWRNPINGTLGTLFEREKALSINGFDEELFPIADYYFTFSYWKKYGARKLKAKLAIYRWGDNESLKRETLIAFIKNDLTFRQNIIDNYARKYGVWNSTLTVISKLLAIRAAYCYKKVNDDFSPPLILKEIGITNKYPVRFILTPFIAVIMKGIVKSLDFHIINKSNNKNTK